MTSISAVNIPARNLQENLAVLNHHEIHTIALQPIHLRSQIHILIFVITVNYLMSLVIELCTHPAAREVKSVG